MDLSTLRHGRESFERRAWAESYRLLQAADLAANCASGERARRSSGWTHPDEF
jgi:hypothetical protein